MWLPLLIVCLGLVIYVIRKSARPANFPPGPSVSLPLVGHSYLLGSDILVGLEKLSVQYGDVFSLDFGPLRSIVLNGYDVIQEAMTQDALAGRPVLPSINLMRLAEHAFDSGDQPGIIMSSGHTWQEQRRFSLRTLRDLGFGKVGMEELVNDEVEVLCKSLESEKGKFLNISKSFNIAAVNALWKVLTGERMSQEDPKVQKLISRIEKISKDQASPVAQLANFNTLLFELMEKIGLSDVRETVKDTYAIFEAAIQEHEKTLQEDDLRDFMDAYLREVNNSTPGSSFHGKKGPVSLKNVILDLFFAGSDTTSATLSWAILYMMKNPTVQDKVHEEIKSVVGTNSLPSWSDRSEFPYCEAVIQEVQRISNIVPLAVMHSALEDTTISGYSVPKGTQIFYSLTSLLMNPEYFPEPHQFNPERFLKNGKFVADPRSLPFGVGKRRCLGETLARLELFKFFTAFFQRFKVVSRPGTELDFTPEPGLLRRPKPFEVKFLPRY